MTQVLFFYYHSEEGLREHKQTGEAISKLEQLGRFLLHRNDSIQNKKTFN